MKTVFILGAGASRPAGGPLMADFLDRADAILQERSDLPGKVEFKRVFDALTRMRSLYAKAYIDLDNIEELLGLVEMGQLVGRVGSATGDEVKALRTALIILIVQTIEYSIRFPADASGVHAPKPFDRLAQLVGERGRIVNSRDTYSFVTFNYDVVLEQSLLSRGVGVSYGLDSQQPNHFVPVLKLHGSVHWGVCSVCQAIVPIDLGGVSHDLWSDTKFVYFDVSKMLPLRQHCKTALPALPLIVPPSWNKGRAQQDLARVWAKAAEELAQADNIVVIGYSLPETDSFFRYLFALAMDSGTRLQRLWVFNPDDDGAVERRFRAFVGRGIERRLQFFTGASGLFENAMQQTDELFPAAR